MLQTSIAYLQETAHGWGLIAAVCMAGLAYAAALAFLTSPIYIQFMPAEPVERLREPAPRSSDPCLVTQFEAFAASRAERAR